VRDAAAHGERAAPSDAAVEAFFGALIDGAREIQERALAAPPSAALPSDLDATLRPALARISERIAWLLVRVPEATTRADAAAALAPLGELGVSERTRARLLTALLASAAR
jgi:cyclohexadienyl dehydratase